MILYVDISQWNVTLITLLIDERLREKIRDERASQMVPLISFNVTYGRSLIQTQAMHAENTDAGRAFLSPHNMTR